MKKNKYFKTEVAFAIITKNKPFGIIDAPANLSMLNGEKIISSAQVTREVTKEEADGIPGCAKEFITLSPKKGKNDKK